MAGERMRTYHRFEYGELIFEFQCPGCELNVELTNPWVDVTCECGAVWRLVATAVRVDDGPDFEEPDPDEAADRREP